VATAFRRLIVGLGLDAPVRRLCGGVGAILMLHRIVEDGWMAEPGLGYTPAMLTAIIATLRRSGYEIVSLDVALRRLAGGGARFACLTFDDGYRDNHDLLWPVLRREGVPATIYLTTGFIDGSRLPWWTILESVIAAHDGVEIDGERHATRSTSEKHAVYRLLHARLEAIGDAERAEQLVRWAEQQGNSVAALGRALFLDWNTIRAMAADGLVAFGSHTVNHLRLSTLPEEQARSEIVQSGRRIAEELGAPPRHFAFPFGNHGDSGPREAHLAKAAGYASAVHAWGGPLVGHPDPMALPRIPLGGEDDTVDLSIRLTGLGPALRGLRHRSSP